MVYLLKHCNTAAKKPKCTVYKIVIKNITIIYYAKISGAVVCSREKHYTHKRFGNAFEYLSFKPHSLEGNCFSKW